MYVYAEILIAQTMWPQFRRTASIQTDNWQAYFLFSRICVAHYCDMAHHHHHYFTACNSIKVPAGEGPILTLLIDYDSLKLRAKCKGIYTQL